MEDLVSLGLKEVLKLLNGGESILFDDAFDQALVEHGFVFLRLLHHHVVAAVHLLLLLCLLVLN